MVSLKVSKKATVRNKIRRRLSEAIKAEGKDIKIGTDHIVPRFNSFGCTANASRFAICPIICACM